MNDSDSTTRPSDDDGDAKSGAGSFPVKSWDRYEFVRYVGGGGMGEVYEARDLRLDRRVALKFMRGHDPAMKRRFLNEARAQAAVKHAHVCPIFEVGEVEGKPFIAMQFIDGLTLDRAALRMTLDQKMLVIKQVAEGLHEAHVSGLIHRDVKPGNVMVESAADGEWTPYLMDFGLARDPESPGMTATGDVVGTALFMSPEQALGHVHTLDRRTDVYGLGATMYAILAGRPPFRGMTPANILSQVVLDVPASLRTSGGAVPADVDAIAMKCLRKDPRERFASALELAEDVGRYLNGDPVLARPTTVFYRIRMKALKHRVAVGVGAVALAAIVAVSAWAAYNGWTSTRRARLAQGFGQDVEHIEAMARYAHLSPLHDIRPERRRIQSEVDEIRARMAELGRIADGPGHYALGRGLMTLERFDEARDNLERAWHSGYRDPEVAYSLGRVLGALYGEALNGTEGIADGELREARREDLRRTYLRPAADYVRQGRDSETPSLAYVEALLAFYEERYDEALDRARAAYESVPWMYEARRLEGDVHRAKGAQLSTRGDYAAAFEHYDVAEAAYRSAAEIGSSDPAVHASLCGLLHLMERTALYGSGEDVTPYFDRATGACGDVLRADPDSAEAYGLISSLHEGMAEYARNRGGDSTQHLQAAFENARKALAIDPAHEGARLSLGNAYLQRARDDQRHQRDPRDTLRRAAEAFETVLDAGPDFAVYNRLGMVHRNYAKYEMDRGEDPRDALQQAIVAYDKSILLNRERAGPYTNLGVAYSRKALYEIENGIDPGDSLDRSIDCYEDALAINPRQMLTHYNLGRVLSDKATHELSRGHDPRPLFTRAAEAYRAAVEVGAESAYVSHFHNGLGASLNSRALYELESGGDPEPTLDEARRAFGEALSINSDNLLANYNVAVNWATLALYELERGDDPRTSVSEALAAGMRVRTQAPGDLDALANDGQALWVRARWELEQGVDPRSSLRAAIEAFREVIEQQPGDAFAQLAMARLQILEGRWRMGSGDDPAPWFDRARVYLDASLALDPDDPDGHLVVADLYRWKASRRVEGGHAPDDDVRMGLEAIDRCLELNPRQAEALAIRGALLLQRAGPGDLENAHEQIERALSINNNLTHRYRPVLNQVNERLGRG